MGFFYFLFQILHLAFHEKAENNSVFQLARGKKFGDEQ